MMECFLDLAEEPADSATRGFEGQIELTSWFWQQGSDSLPATVAEDATPLEVNAFHFSKVADRATPKLMFACLSGQRLPRAVLTCRVVSGQRPRDLLRITLLNVRLSSYRIYGGVEDSERAMEEVGLTFTKLLFEWIETRQDGAFGRIVRCGWDVQSDESF